MPLLESLRGWLAGVEAKVLPKSPMARAVGYVQAQWDALMRYAALRRDGLPIGSGATESGCALFQLRVKHPGSHWRDDLAGVMTARGLSLSDRWELAFEAFHQMNRAEVAAA